MAQMDDQGGGDGGGDWFAQNAPAPQGAAPKATAADVSLMYRNLLGREASADEVQNQLTGGSYDLNTIQASISSSPEASAYQQSNPTGKQTTTPTPPVPTGGGDAALRAQIAQWASMPGSDPSLGNDPDYWVRAINSRGGLTDANRQYWQDASVGPTAFFNNPGRESSNANINAAPAPGSFTAPPSPYASNPNAPSPYEPATWTGGPPPSAPTLSRYTAPTLAELEASPGYLSRLSAVQKVRERSAAAQGSILNPGTQVALGRDAQNFASNEYGNIIGQGLAITNTNNNAAQTEFGDTFAGYQSRYGQFTDANAYGQQGYTNKNNAYLADNARTLTDYLTNTSTQRNANNDYWSHLNDLYQAGLGAANNSYKPGVTL